MEICIPLNEANWEGFYYKAKAAGVFLKSRYEGVVVILHRSSRLPAFLARYQSDGNRRDIEYFPFTKEGELEAKQAYNTYVGNLKHKPKRNRKYEEADSNSL